MAAKPSTTLGPFPIGINNLVEGHRLPVGAVRDAVNVDLESDGRFRRRRGTIRRVMGNAVTSLWSDDKRAFFVDGRTLYEMRSDNSKVALLAGVNPNVAFCPIPGRGIAFTDGQLIKRIVGSTVVPFAVAGPQAGPVLTGSAGGSLPAGEYQIACTFLNAAGEESSTVEDQVAVPPNGMITIGLPRATEPETTQVGIYTTSLNGTDLFLVAVVPITTTTYVISTPMTSGRQPSTRFTIPLPPGDMLEFHNGRTYSHANGLLAFTDAWSGQHSPIAGIVPLPRKVSILYATPGGLWIVADQTYYLEGDPTQAQGTLRVRSPTRAVPGTLVRLPDNTGAMWFTERGWAQVSGGGDQIEFIQRQNVAVQPASQGAALFREQEGKSQVIATVRDPGITVAGASSWFSATISSGEVRNEFP